MDIEVRAGFEVDGIQSVLGRDFKEWYGSLEFYECHLNRDVGQVEVGDLLWG